MSSAEFYLFQARYHQQTSKNAKTVTFVFFLLNLWSVTTNRKVMIRKSKKKLIVLKI
jgi:hypothetical protein